MNRLDCTFKGLFGMENKKCVRVGQVADLGWTKIMTLA